MKHWIFPVWVLLVVVLFSSCAAVIHPNEKLIIGEWKPVKVEKYFTPEEEELLKHAQVQSTGTRPVQPGEKPVSDAGGNPQAASPSTPPSDQSRNGDNTGGKNPEAELNNLIQAETRSNMKIFPDKTIEKSYRVKTLQGTWKMKGEGTVVVVKVPEKGEKYRIDILEIVEGRMVVVGNLPIGGIKIEYEKIGDAIKEKPE